MDDKNNDVAQNEYIHEVDESAVSNPFSNAFKSILQKLHLIKNDQKLIGDKHTNSKGFQTTREDVLKATESTSLKGFFRNMFEDMQKKRLQKAQEKNAVNTMPKYTVGQTISDPTVEKALSDKEATKTIIPTQKSITEVRKTPIVEKINVDSSVSIDTKTEEGFSGSDTSSSEGTLSDAEIVPESAQPQTAKNVVIMAETMVAPEADEPKSKTAISKGKDEADPREI